MDKAYKDCLSQSMEQSACEATLKNIEDQIDSGLAVFVTPIPATTASSGNNENNVEVVITQPVYTYGYPTPVRPTPYFEQTPRNSFTPKPGFTPENKYQGGEGLKPLQNFQSESSFKN